MKISIPGKVSQIIVASAAIASTGFGAYYVYAQNAAAPRAATLVQQAEVASPSPDVVTTTELVDVPDVEPAPSMSPLPSPVLTPSEEPKGNATEEQVNEMCKGKPDWMNDTEYSQVKAKFCNK